MRGPNGGPDNPGPALNPFADEASQPFGQLLAVGFRRFVPMEDRQGKKNAALVIHASEARMRDCVEALLAAIIGMGAPADIRQKAGRMAKTPFVSRLFKRGIGENPIGPAA